MSLRIRIILTAAVAAASIAVAGASATAAPGPNNQNAKKCQKGGYQSVYTSFAGTFSSEEQCVSYAARGGTLIGPFAGKVPCIAVGGTFAPFDHALWSCLVSDLATTESPELSQACQDDIAAVGGYGGLIGIGITLPQRWECTRLG
jgi:hypothetical protein